MTTTMTAVATGEPAEAERIAARGRDRFHFGPRETRGLLLGLSGPQLATMLAGLGALAAGLNRGMAGALAGLMVLVILLLAALAPLSGRTALQWAPIVLGFAAQRALGEDRYRHALTDEAELPGPLVGLQIRAVEVPGLAGTAIGVVEESRRGTMTAVAAVTGAVLPALLDPDDADGRIIGWGGLLAGLAREGSVVQRLQWVARTVPDQGHDLARFWASANASGPGENGGTGRTGVAAAASYRQLLEALTDPASGTGTGPGGGLWRHDTYVAVTVDARSRRGLQRRAGGRDRYALLLQQVAALQAGLAQCDLEVSGWLPPQLLARVLREAYEPAVARAPGPAQPADGDRDAKAPGIGTGRAQSFGPMATANEWTCFRSDDAWHATYWICEWPRSPVDGDFLTPLLTATCGPGVRRTVSLLAEPIDPRTAARATASARTAEAANQALRDRVGQLTTERTRSEAADVVRREQELAQGHGDYRFLGLLTVTAPTERLLDQACAQAEHDAHAAGLEVRRLYGEQDQAFAASLPLARGLR